MPGSISDLMLGLPDGEDVDLGRLLDTFGSRAHGTALFLLSVPDAIPLPVPSVGAILGVPIAIVSLHLAVFGETARLPAPVRRRRMPARAIGLMKRYVAPFLARIERLSRPRLRAVAAQARFVGLVCLALSLLLLLPIPFMNTPPSLCLALLAWGMVQRDGVVVAAGLAATAALGLALLVLVDRVVALVA